MTHLLLVETDTEYIESFLAQASELNMTAIAAASVPEALIRYHQRPPHALLIGPGISVAQFDALKAKLKEAQPAYYLLSEAGATTHSDSHTKTEALKKTMVVIKRDCTAGLTLSEEPDSPYETHFAEFVGRSAAMKKLYNEIRKVAKTDLPVLLIGESGTGKELAARAIHRHSNRHLEAYIPINCAAISSQLIESELFGHEKGSFTGADKNRQGYFEIADGGTLFLDEVTEMPLEAQTKLLRILENGQYMKVGGASILTCDTRIIAATNRPPSKAISDKKLREDLYYRLGVFPIKLPPLRDRDGDAQLIAMQFVEQLNDEHGKQKKLTEGSLRKIADYDWPGNIRELKNAILRSYILSNGSEIDVNPELGRVE